MYTKNYQYTISKNIVVIAILLRKNYEFGFKLL